MTGERNTPVFRFKTVHGDVTVVALLPAEGGDYPYITLGIAWCSQADRNKPSKLRHEIGQNLAIKRLADPRRQITIPTKGLHDGSPMPEVRRRVLEYLFHFLPSDETGNVLHRELGVEPYVPEGKSGTFDKWIKKQFVPAFRERYLPELQANG